MDQVWSAASSVIARCRSLAQFTEERGFTTRTFLSKPMHRVHEEMRAWMERAGMTVSIDPAGNLRGRYASSEPGSPSLILGSHLDTVPRAGAFDGILGVVLAAALVELLAGRRLSFGIEVVGFSEEEGVRFSAPFIGSRAFIGDVDEKILRQMDASGVSVGDAIRNFGLDPERIADARWNGEALGYVEFHIEQGPVLESLDLPLGVVDAIAGQTRLGFTFEGRANHAGTTPMHLRKDALAGAAEWIGRVEHEASVIDGLVATVGKIEAEPGADNVIAGRARASLDVRHAKDDIRECCVTRLIGFADEIAQRRGLTVSVERRLEQPAVAMDDSLTQTLERAVAQSGYSVHRIMSGAGHDAMIVARTMPAAMLFVRSPGGISHHPDENVLIEDVAAALAAGLRFLEELESSRG